MPRGGRRDGPGLIQHVVVKGVDGMPLFRDDADRARLATRLSKVLTQADPVCLAWAFMLNHIHLLLISGLKTSISSLAQRVIGPYAQGFNVRHGRHGPIVNGRFFNRVVADDRHLFNAIRYVLVNPVEAGVVSFSELAAYAWCGFGALLGRRDDGITSCDQTLRLFAPDDDAARRRLTAWMEDGLADESAFLEMEALVESAPMMVFDVADRRASGASIPNLFALESFVATRAGITTEEMESRARSAPVSNARAVFALLALRVTGARPIDVAERLGVGQPAVSYMLEKGSRLLTRAELERLEASFRGFVSEPAQSEADR